MLNATVRSSRPDPWTLPRPFCDANQRYLTYGPLQPMDDDDGRPGLLRRLLGAR